MLSGLASEAQKGNSFFSVGGLRGRFSIATFVFSRPGGQAASESRR